MKKFWEKNNLVKVVGIMVVFAALLTWLIPQAEVFRTIEVTDAEIVRLGIMDFFQYIVMVIPYFSIYFIFVFVLAAFYQVISKIGAYQRLTSGIAKAFKSKEWIFAIIASLIFAVLAALTTEYVTLVIFIPFVITIISKMKLSKITAFAVTFGSIIVGLMGSLYNFQVAGHNVDIFGGDYAQHFWVRIALLVSAFVVFNLFNVLHIKKTLKTKKSEVVEDPFATEETPKKDGTSFNVGPWILGAVGILFVILSFLNAGDDLLVPAVLVVGITLLIIAAVAKFLPKATFALLFGLFALITILAYLPWDAFGEYGVQLFSDLTRGFIGYELTIPGIMSEVPIFAYIFGNVPAFGNWNMVTIQILLLVTMFVMKWTYKISTDDFIASIGDGLKKVAKLAGLLLLIHAIIVITMYSNVIPTVVYWLMDRIEGFSLFFGTISAFIGSVFTIKYQFLMHLVGSHFSVTYSEYTAQLAIMFQAVYGFVAMLAPTSLLLLVGLFYSNISYKEWLKYIWKFLIIMLLIILSILAVVFELSIVWIILFGIFSVLSLVVLVGHTVTKK